MFVAGADCAAVRERPTPTVATANDANQKRFMPFFSSQRLCTTSLKDIFAHEPLMNVSTL
jgi:hypothetical protein